MLLCIKYTIKNKNYICNTTSIYIMRKQYTHDISVSIGNASVAVEEVREVGSVGVSLSPHSNSLQHTSVPQLLHHKFIVTLQSFLLLIRFDAAHEVRRGRKDSLHEQVEVLSEMSADCQQFLWVSSLRFARLSL